MVMARTMDGFELTWNILLDILEKQLGALMSSNPTRDSAKVCASQGSLMNKDFVRRFAKRNNLIKHVLTKNTANGSFDCNKCEKTFTFKNALVKHIKTLHK